MTREAPCGAEVDFMVGCERDEIRSFGHPAEQLALGMCDERSTFASPAQTYHAVHHLIGAPVQLRDVSMCSENTAQLPTPKSQVPTTNSQRI